MGDLTLEILIFAAIAAFIGHRLWLALGQREGERPIAKPDPFKPAPALPAREPALALPGQPEQRIPATDYPLSLEGSLSQIRAAMPEFNEKQFLAGAKTAFGLIVGAFARGDRDTLRPLLGEDVYASFDNAITVRAQEGKTLDTQILKIDADIEVARLTGSVARLTVGFKSTQINLVRDAHGTVIEGNPNRSEDIVDIWTFARDTGSSNPNWTLVETRHQS
jgi:predicted lipid-binding transport protein (Tim44 family)